MLSDVVFTLQSIHPRLYTENTEIHYSSNKIRLVPSFLNLNSVRVLEHDGELQKRGYLTSVLRSYRWQLLFRILLARLRSRN